ncbi:MAG: uroporphyrinogen-III synthase [Pyrinomonadaceae bacterium]
MIDELSKKETVGVFKSGKNKKLIELLKSQNKSVIEFLQVKTEAVIFDVEKLNILKKIRQYDWLIFTDIYTVDYFMAGLEKTGFELFELDKFRICACGEAVADKLRFVQIHSDVIPPKKSAEVTVSALSDYIFDDAEFLDSNVLIIKSEDINSEISKLLLKKRIKNVEIEVYRTLSVSSLENAKLNTLLSVGDIDRFIFTSAEDVESLLILSKNAQLSKYLSGIEIETTDEVTSQILSENLI